MMECVEGLVGDEVLAAFHKRLDKVKINRKAMMEELREKVMTDE